LLCYNPNDDLDRGRISRHRICCRCLGHSRAAQDRAGKRYAAETLSDGSLRRGGVRWLGQNWLFHVEGIGGPTASHPGRPLVRSSDCRGNSFTAREGYFQELCTRREGPSVGPDASRRAPNYHRRHSWYARCSVYILRSPNFLPEEAQIGQVVSIGNGSVFQPYRDVLQSFSSDPMSLMQMAPAGAGASSLTLAMAIQKTVERNPLPGVSPHAHICLVQGGGLAVFPNDHKVFPQSGHPTEFKMPRVATTWDEFDRMASADGHSSACAVC
jgi:hypothetical protein